MYQSKAWTFGLFIVAWLCHSLLLIGAQNPITNPEEGEFALFVALLDFMIHKLLLCLSSSGDACLEFSQWAYARFSEILLMNSLISYFIVISHVKYSLSEVGSGYCCI